MAGRRHHTIPRFLLKGFASSQSGDDPNVWMYRTGKKGIEVNVKNVGVENDFYGTPQESDLDTQITALENEYAPLVDDLRLAAGDSCAISHPKIPNLVAHLSLRTRQLRQSVCDLTDSMLQQLQEYLNQEEVVQQTLSHELGRDGPARNAFKSYLAANGVSAENLEAVLAEFQPRLPELSAKLMPSFAPTFRARVDEFISESRLMLPEAMRGGYIASLSRNLGAEHRSATYAQHTWFVLRPTVPVLLGDTVCLLETDGRRRFKPLDEVDDTILRVYVPLSSDCLLIGAPCKWRPETDIRLLNRAIARCSYEFFVSSQALPDESSLAKGLGKWSGILSHGEAQSLIDQMKQDFLKY